MAKIKKVIFGLFLAMFAVVALSSCNKDNDDTPVVSETVVAPSEQVVARDLSKQLTLLRANSYDFYTVDRKYKDAYRHLLQGDKECSWTSYVLAAAAVARGESQYYPSGNAVPLVKDYRAKIKDAKSKSTNEIVRIESYSKIYDKGKYNKVKVRREKYYTFDEAVFGFLRERKNGNNKPCIFITSAPGRNNKRIGHYVILWDIVWGGTAASSYVWITDPLDGNEYSFSSYSGISKYKTVQEVVEANIMQVYNFLYFD